jgi:Domain of unknown function (DUF4105)
MRYFLLGALIFFSTTLFAGKRISLLTCGAGEEVYSTFGHSALRIYDSATKQDMVYNYGMFDFSDPNFLPKYIQGELLYFGAADNFDGFMGEYISDKRSVTEQVLNLNTAEIVAIENGIAQNDLPENKYYKYDFCFLNCSTKLRDLFSKSLGASFVYKDYMPADSITFMDILNTYLVKPHWIRVGINCILSSKVHAKMNSFQSMFLPKGLAKGFDNATINGKPLVMQTNVLNPEGINATISPNTPLYFFLILAATFFGLGFWDKAKRFMNIVDHIWFPLLGILGLFFLFMWFGTDHSQTKHNMILLWTLPTHVLWAVWRKKTWFAKYCTFAASFGTLFLIMHMLIQPIAFEVLPIVLYTFIRLRRHAMGRV